MTSKRILSVYRDGERTSAQFTIMPSTVRAGLLLGGKEKKTLPKTNEILQSAPNSPVFPFLLKGFPLPISVVQAQQSSSLHKKT